MEGGWPSRATFPTTEPPNQEDQQKHQEEVRECPLNPFQLLVPLVTLEDAAVVSVAFQSVRGHPVPAKPYFVSTHDTGL
jgi:hypothetical protein